MTPTDEVEALLAEAEFRASPVRGEPWPCDPTTVYRLVAALRMALLCDEIDYGTLDTIAAILKGAKP